MMLKYSSCFGTMGHMAGRRKKYHAYYPLGSVYRLNGWNTYIEGTKVVCCDPLFNEIDGEPAVCAANVVDLLRS